VREIIARLERGERWWAAELLLRGAGCVALGILTLLSRWICRLVLPPQHVGPLQFTIAAAAFVCLSAGLALTLEGPGLFRSVPMPPRALLT